jgi:hypothetical protein
MNNCRIKLPCSAHGAIKVSHRADYRLTSRMALCRIANAMTALADSENWWTMHARTNGHCGHGISQAVRPRARQDEWECRYLADCASTELVSRGRTASERRRNANGDLLAGLLPSRSMHSTRRQMVRKYRLWVIGAMELQSRLCTCGRYYNFH